MTAFDMAMLVCNDIEKSRNFYRNILGLRVVTDASPHWVEFDLGGGHKLGIHPARNGLASKAGALQLTFRVDDVGRFVNDARVAGIPVLQEPFDERWGRAAVIADPDGYPVQIVSYNA